MEASENKAIAMLSKDEILYLLGMDQFLVKFQFHYLQDTSIMGCRIIM